jgi:hypothetical protein
MEIIVWFELIYDQDSDLYTFECFQMKIWNLD